MNAFPEFMRNPANRIARSAQATPGVEGYIFDGADGTQMAFWTCSESACSVEQSSEKHLGAECVDDKNIWDADFPAHPDEYQEHDQ